MKAYGYDIMSTVKRLPFIIALFIYILIGSYYVYFWIYSSYPTQKTSKFDTLLVRDNEVKFEEVKDLLRENTTDLSNSRYAVATPSAKNLNPPECDNVLNNITKGRWVRKIHMPRYKNQTQLLLKEEERLESELRIFWVKRGIQTAFWRQDFRCGYYNYESQPYKTRWFKVGSWCNPKGERPCCTNKMRGTCMKPSDASCRCAGCVDLRTYKYADVSEWIVADTRCKWNKYTASEICQVIEHSPFSDIHFVGDSFMRNMFRTFSMMVTNDFDHGAVNISTSLPIRKLCTKMQQYFWKECRKTLYDLSKTFDPKKLCGGRGYLNFSAVSEPFYNTKFRNNFLNLVKSKINVPGSLIVVSVGFHMQCESSNAIKNFLDPAIQAISQHYGSPPDAVDPRELSGRWPQIVLCLPLSIGLLKPPTFLTIQNDVKCDAYCSEMKAYSRMHDIRVLDFRELTKLVYSFDGTHHGINVNRMKNLILLNYIASIKV